MAPIFSHFFSSPHDAVVKAVKEALGSKGWQVDVEPIVGNVRPDIVAREPNGTSYVIEVKEGDSDANLGAVAQVETFRNAVAEDRGGEVKGMLLVTGDMPEELGTIAKSANVELVKAASPDRDDVLQSLEGASVGESAVA